MPWQKEDDLKECYQSHEEKHIEVKDDISENLRGHEPFIVIDYDELMNFRDIDESDGEDESSDFNMVNPNLNIVNSVSNGDSSRVSVPPATVESILLPPKQFYSMCFQLEDAQKHFLCFIMTYIMK